MYMQESPSSRPKSAAGEDPSQGMLTSPDLFISFIYILLSMGRPNNRRGRLIKRLLFYPSEICLSYLLRLTLAVRSPRSTSRSDFSCAQLLKEATVLAIVDVATRRCFHGRPT